MLPLNFNYQQPPFEKTIQLYGDRTGGQGNFEFAGLAELQKVKLLLVRGNEKSLQQPTDWRRFLRLINLAQRLNKPIVLWNLPIAHIATTQHHASLTLATTIQNVKIQLLKLPLPIIAVFDNVSEVNTAAQEIGCTDGTVILASEPKELTTLSKSQQNKLKIVSEQRDIPTQIIELLQEMSTKSIEDLITKRLETYRKS